MNGNGHAAEGRPNATELARLAQKQHKPKRFYTKVSLEERSGGLALTLDGRTAKTPGKAPLVVTHRHVAEAMADEWSSQGGEIDPVTMPVTRIVNSAIDAVAERMEAVRAEIVSYSGTDLLAYRATFPEALIARQRALWDPVLDWAEGDLGARILTVSGIVHVNQPPESLEAVAASIVALDPVRLAALHVVTTLTGSAILAVAVHRGRLAPEAAWHAAHVDEDWEVEQWGTDAEASARREARWADMRAAAFVLAR